MVVEAMILYCDHRVFQRGRDLIQRDVVPLFVHPEPGLAVRGVEPRVADAAPKLEHCPALPHGPDDDHRRDGDEAEVRRRKDPALHSWIDHLARRAFSHSDSTT